MASLDLGYRRRLLSKLEWSAGVGTSLADRRNMQTYFGISEAEAARSGRLPYAASAGAKDVFIGTGVTGALNARWIAFANIGATRLIGDAANSPLVSRPTAFSAGLGLAYRCCDP